ncbi:MAG TPA: type II toxin-antitoxin system Phd/YefM family antitoxin [Anaerolineae bacterium]|nr:type II toxin-antitoxin system Phd/YefM family antitoxin [Anaerolineae bacterium]HIP71051.1 type II toxin-antitoxin system Phd/YefM family antitoxin [Anaerolineae bacterium]
MQVTKMSSREARAHWRDVLDTVDKGDADVIIERYGKPIATLIPFADYQALLAELEDLRDGRLAMAALEEWERDPSTARPYEEFRAELIAEGIWDEESE